MSDQPSDWERAAATLDAMLEQTNRSTLGLPALSQPEPETGTWLSRLLEWLNSFFPQWNPSFSSTSGFAHLLEPLVYAAVAFLLTWILLKIGVHVWTTLRKKRLTSALVQSPTQNSSPWDDVRDAVAADNIALAMRLRWLMFLEASQLPRHTTPHEYARMVAASFYPAKGEAPEQVTFSSLSADRAIAVMFGRSPSERSVFQEWHQTLSTLEATPSTRSLEARG